MLLKITKCLNTRIHLATYAACFNIQTEISSDHFVKFLENVLGIQMIALNLKSGRFAGNK